MRMDTIARLRDGLAAEDTTDTPRFSALEWLTIATLARATPGRDEELLRSLRTLYSQCETDPDRARLDALIGMSALIGAVGADAFSRRLDKFLKAGFSEKHLHMLGTSLARRNHDALRRGADAETSRDDGARMDR